MQNITDIKNNAWQELEKYLSLDYNEFNSQAFSCKLTDNYNLVVWCDVDEYNENDANGEKYFITSVRYNPYDSEFGKDIGVEYCTQNISQQSLYDSIDVVVNELNRYIDNSNYFKLANQYCKLQPNTNLGVFMFDDNTDKIKYFTDSQLSALSQYEEREDMLRKAKEYLIDNGFENNSYPYLLIDNYEKFDNAYTSLVLLALETEQGLNIFDAVCDDIYNKIMKRLDLDLAYSYGKKLTPTTISNVRNMFKVERGKAYLSIEELTELYNEVVSLDKEQDEPDICND